MRRFRTSDPGFEAEFRAFLSERRGTPDDVDAVIELGSWPVSPLFRLARELTPLMATEELYRTLNVGIGMVIVCAADVVDALQSTIAEPTWIIGALRPGTGTVHLT